MAALADHIWPPSRSVVETQAFIVQTLHAAWPTGSITAADHQATGDVAGRRQQLHQALRRRGLTPAHVPDLVMSHHHFGSARCHLEAVAYATSLALRKEAALALRGNQPALQLPTVPSELWPSMHVHSLAEHLSGTPNGLALLEMESDALATELENEPWRADPASLRPLRQVPKDVLLQAGLASDPTIGKVAAAWTWLEIGRGAWSAGWHSRVLRGRVRRFDEDLTPEARHRLLEHAHDFATAVQNDVAAEHVWETAASTGRSRAAKAG